MYYYRIGNTYVDSKTVIIVGCIFAVYMIAVTWRIFTKAGRAGWKCLIPIYGSYVQWDIAWDGSKFLMIFFGGLGLSVLGLILRMLGQAGAMIFLIIEIIWAIYVLVLTVQMVIRMAHRFGKSTAFGVIGLLIFSIIGMSIIAWGSADYNAARDTGDGILRSDVQIRVDEEKSNDYWDRINSNQ